MHPFGYSNSLTVQTHGGLKLQSLHRDLSFAFELVPLFNQSSLCTKIFVTLSPAGGEGKQYIRHTTRTTSSNNSNAHTLFKGRNM